MTRGNARELAVHLIYSREFTGQEPEQEVAVRLDKEYYPSLSQENAVYADRPSAAQLRYIDSVVSGVANRENELNEQIRKFSIGWDISRISRLTRCVLQLAIYEILFVEDVPTGVAISEAVRLAKMYDGEEAGSFTNGILGAFARSLPQEEKRAWGPLALTPVIIRLPLLFLTERVGRTAPNYSLSSKGSWVCASPMRYLPISKACRSCLAGYFPILKGCRSPR